MAAEKNKKDGEPRVNTAADAAQIMEGLDFETVSAEHQALVDSCRAIDLQIIEAGGDKEKIEELQAQRKEIEKAGPALAKQLHVLRKKSFGSGSKEEERK